MAPQLNHEDTYPGLPLPGLRAEERTAVDAGGALGYPEDETVVAKTNLPEENTSTETSTTTEHTPTAFRRFAAEARQRNLLRASRAQPPSLSTPRLTQPVHEDTNRMSVGEVIDHRYRIVGVRGQGGMSKVYEARHLTLNKRVAIKVLHPELIEDGEASARFVREAFVGGALEHPGITPVIDYGSLEDGSGYLVMPLAQGTSLADMMRGHPAGMDWRMACTIATQVLDALAAAHAVGVVHRDIKPEHIIVELDSEGGLRTKVIDFGLAALSAPRLRTEGEDPLPRDLTEHGSVLGTIGYMAPEQLRAEAADHRADLYSLGVVLWEMLVGRSLFTRSSRIEAVRQQLNELVQSPREASRRMDIPENLDSLILELLRTRPEERPGSASEVAKALRQTIGRAWHDSHVRARRSSAQVMFETTLNETHSSPMSSPPATLAGRDRLRWAVGTTVIAGMVSAVAYAVLAW